MSDLGERLQRIRTFPSLVKFLREDLDWPVDSGADFEDLTFEYSPEELGIDPANAAKIEEIKRLRPLVSNQPWGIFFVKFEPRQLPVVALRRILNRVVVKKRATPSAAEQKHWATDDLLFISAYGADDERRISFAHFSQDSAATDLPTLKVLAWDDLDTGLHLDDVAKRLVEHLSWPSAENHSNDQAWRERWASAFELRHREVVATSKALATRLAQLARAIRLRIQGVLEIENERGPVTLLMEAFRESLVHDLEPDDFADMYAQTIAYGLLSTRVANPSSDGVTEYVPVTNPFLRELMETFLQVGETDGASRGIDFDELGVSDVVQLLDDVNMEAVIRDFGDKNPEEDPVIHFYELFLKEYDAKKRMTRGVFYTPRPVVSYIVRSVHELLQTEFGLNDGLADTTTWGEVAARYSGLTIPKGAKPTDRFVTILDPATGTGTFLVEVIGTIYRTLRDKWKRQGHGEQEILDFWNAYVPKHLLPRLHGYELLMAPYAIAHLKIGIKLHETGYRFESDERARIYLTNALEPAHDFSDRLEFAIPALAHESQAVSDVKATAAVTVVVGNPPYSIMSANLSPECRVLVDPFRCVDGVKITEKSAIVFERTLQDDYVKFFGLADEIIGSSGAGILSFISNNGYLENINLRGLRWKLLSSYAKLGVVDLHGDADRREVTASGEPDKNVFDIKKGVAILVARKLPGAVRAGAEVSRADLMGSRVEKYRTLLANSLLTLEHVKVATRPDKYVFSASNAEVADEFDDGVAVSDLFCASATGIETGKDSILVAFDREELKARLIRFGDTSLSDATVREEFDAEEGCGRTIADLRKTIPTDNEFEKRLVPFAFAPFDER